MRISYTVTTQSCPSCGHVFKRSNSLWLYIVVLALLPISLPTLIAFNFLSEKVFLSPSVPTIGNPIKTCPKCGLKIKSGKVEKESLSKVELLDYQFRWLFRLSYLLGGIAILFLIGFIFGLFDYDNTVLYCLYISLGAAFIIFIIAYIYRKKSNNISKDDNANTKATSTATLPIVDPIAIAKITSEIEEEKENKRDAFYQHLLLIPRDFAFNNGHIEEYKQIELEIGASIRSHLKVYEMMFGQFYDSDNENDKDTVLALEEFAFAIGIYYLFELDKVYPNIRTGDIIDIINKCIPEQFNMQLSLLDNTDLEYVDKEELIKIINKKLNLLKQD